MKLQQQRTFVRVEGAINSQTFKIQEGSKLIKILSENLYKDKVLAIVRELSTNCIDAHTKAGKPKEPFTVRLPSALNTNFEIRDFGLGLNSSEISDIYRWYGRSDKDDNNDMVGALGLGAKCPFSYNTKSFTIETVYEDSNKKKRDIYAAYINEDGIPNIDLLSSEDSAEKTGVKVSIPCCATDIYNFQTAATKVFPWFDVKPKFLGQSVPKIPEVENIISSPNGWAIRKENYGVHDGLVAKMGVITYPINFEDSNLPDKVRDLFNCPITLEFALGELDISPGREDLSYNTQTKTNIVAKCNLVIDELKQKVEDELAAAKTLFAARKTVGQVNKKLPSYKLQAIIPTNELEWNKKKLFPQGFLGYGLNSYLPKDFGGVEYSVSQISMGYTSKPRVQNSRSILWESDFEIIISDCKIGNLSRAKEYLEKNNTKIVYLVSFPDHATHKAFTSYLGADESEFIKASSLPKPTPQPRNNSGSGKIKTTKVMEFTHGTSRGMSTWWNTTSIDINWIDGTYVEFNNYAAYDGQDKVMPYVMKQYIDNVNVLLKYNSKSEIGTVYGVKTAIIPKLTQATTKWTNVFDVIREQQASLAKNADFVEAKLLRAKFSIGGSDYIKRNNYYHDYLYKLDLDSLISLKKIVKNDTFGKLVDKLVTQKENIDEWNDVIIAYEQLENFYKPHLAQVNIDCPDAIQKTIYKDWPLLRQLRQGFKDFDLLIPYMENL